MRRSHLSVALAAWTIAALCGAELSPSYKDWPSTPAGFLLTKAEKKAYQDISTDAEAQAFIDLFWAKRDPDLNTVVNEFKLDFDMRVAAADKYFSTEKVKGSVSDRGRTLLLLGKASGSRTLPAGSVAEGTAPGESPGAGYRDRGATEIWVYAKDKLPPGTKADQIYFVFAETRVGLNDFVLDRGDTRNGMSMKILGEQPDRLLLHPKLTEVPKLGILPGSKAASATQLGLFAQGEVWPEGAMLMTAEGALSESLHPLWVYIELPDTVPPATQAVGVVRDAATGKEAGSFAVGVTPVSVAGGRAYEFSFPVDAGTWKADIALLNDSGPLAVKSVQATTEPVPPEGACFSPFYWGMDVRQEAQAHLGDPFNIGGWHMLPRVSGRYSSQESLAYFGFVIRPGLDEQGKPQVTVALALFSIDKEKGTEKKLTERPAEPASLSQIGGDLWMYGSSLPMSIFRKSGDYRLDITLADVKSKASRTAKIPVNVTVEAAPTPAPAPATQ